MIDAADGTQLIVEAIFKWDPLSVVTLVYQELQNLLATRSQEGELYQN